MGHEREAVEIAHHLLRMGHRDEPLEIKLKTDKKKGVERAIFYFRALQCRLFDDPHDALEPRTIIQFGIDDYGVQSGPRLLYIFFASILSLPCRRHPFRVLRI
jgi:hypothetical protein